MPVGLFHDFKGLIDKVLGHCLMKEVTHRVDENHFRRFPLQWLRQPLWPQCQVEPSFVWMANHATEALSNSLGVTIIATGADLCAAGRGVPRSVGPFDLCVLTHAFCLEHKENKVNMPPLSKQSGPWEVVCRSAFSSSPD